MPLNCSLQQSAASSCAKAADWLWPPCHARSGAPRRGSQATQVALGHVPVARDGSSTASTSGREWPIAHRIQFSPKVVTHHSHHHAPRSRAACALVRCSAAEIASARVNIEALGFQEPTQHAGCMSELGAGESGAHMGQTPHGGVNGLSSTATQQSQQHHQAHSERAKHAPGRSSSHHVKQQSAWQHARSHPSLSQRQHVNSNGSSTSQRTPTEYSASGTVMTAGSLHESGSTLEQLLGLYEEGLEGGNATLLDPADLLDSNSTSLDPHVLQPSLNSTSEHEHQLSIEMDGGLAMVPPPQTTMSRTAAMALTSRIYAASAWRDLCTVLHELGETCSATSLLPATAPSTSAPLSAAVAHPQYLAHILQQLNYRHVAVLWLTLARIVPEKDQLGKHMDEGLGAAPQDTAAPHALRNEWSRADSVLLSRVLSSLEQRSLQCMAPTPQGGRCEWGENDLASMAWAMGRVGYSPSQRWLRAFVQASMPVLGSMQPKHLAMAVWGLGTMGLHPGTAWLDDARLFGLQLLSTKQLTAQGAAMVLWGIARMQASTPSPSVQQPAFHCVPLPWLTEYVCRTTPLLKAHPQQHLAMTVWALGSLAAQHGHVTTQLQAAACQLLAIAAAAGAELGAPSVAMTLWGAAQLRLFDDTHTHSTASSRLRTLMQARADSAAGADAASTSAWQLPPGSRSAGDVHRSVLQLLDASQQLLPSMSAQNLCNCAWAAATMEARPPAAWVRALLAAVSGQLPDMEPRGLATLLWACCRMGVRPDLPWMAACMEAVQERLPLFCDRSLPMLMWGLSGLGYRPSTSWGKAFSAATAGMLPSFSPGALAITVLSLSQMNTVPNERWVTSFLTSLQPHIATTAGVAPRAGLSPASATNETGDEALPRAPAQPLSAADLSAALQGMARLGMTPPPRMLDQVEAILLTSLQRQPASSAQQHTDKPLRLGLRQLAGCLYGLVRLRHAVNEQLLVAAAAALEQHAAAALSGAAVEDTPAGVSAATATRRHAPDVSQLLWSLAMLGYEPPADQMQSFLTITHACMPHMSSPELAECAWAIQRMGATPPAAWLQQLVNCAHAHLGSSMLISTATLLRALLIWGAAGPPEWAADAADTATDTRALLHGAATVRAPSAADAASVGAASLPPATPPVVLSTEWLEAAAAAVERGAAVRTRGVRNAAPGSVPFGVVAARAALVSAAGASLTRANAKRRLAAVERLPGQLTAKVADAARRALAAWGHPTYRAGAEQEAVAVGSGTRTRPELVTSAAARVGAAGQPSNGRPAAAGAMTRSAKGVRGSSNGNSGGEAAGKAVSGPGTHSYDGLYPDHDLRYMPW